MSRERFAAGVLNPAPACLALVSLLAASAVLEAGTAGAVAAGKPSPSSPAATEAAARLWLAGDAEGALERLTASGAAGGREAALNRVVVLLYLGRAAEAEGLLVDLTQHQPRWTPVRRWVARTQKDLGRPAVVDTTVALLASPGADSRDHLWAGQLFTEKGDQVRARAAFARAVTEESDLYLGWLALADAEAALGNRAAARQAWTRARELYGGGVEVYSLGRLLWDEGRTEEARALFQESLRSLSARDHEEQIRRLAPDLPPAAPAELPPVGSVLFAGERLQFRVKYLLFRLAGISVEDLGRSYLHGHWAHRVRCLVRSNPAYFFLRVNSRYESLIAEAGMVLAHTNATDDSTAARRSATYEMDPATARCLFRHVTVGLFGYDRLPLPPGAQDGVSVLQLARAVARTRGSVSVLTAVDGTWKGTQVRTVGVEPFKWRGRKVSAIRVQAVGRYRGPGGLAGLIDFWVADDARAVPYRSKMKVAVGSVVLDLVPDDN